MQIASDQEEAAGSVMFGFLQAARRSYPWCNPPTCGTETTDPICGSCLRRKIFSALRAALERVPNSRNCRTSWDRSRSIETKRGRECAVLMELGACHECATGSNLVFREDFCLQTHRVRIFCGGQVGASGFEPPSSWSRTTRIKI